MHLVILIQLISNKLNPHLLGISKNVIQETCSAERGLASARQSYCCRYRRFWRVLASKHSLCWTRLWYAIILSFSISSAYLTRLRIFLSKNAREVVIGNPHMIAIKTNAIFTLNLKNCSLIFIMITFLTKSGVLNVSLIVDIETSGHKALTSADIVNIKII